MLRFQVQGMTCGHCIATVTAAVRSVEPCAEVTVDLRAGSVLVKTSAKLDEVANAINRAGYRVLGTRGDA
jgi:copper chaperone